MKLSVTHGRIIRSSEVKYLSSHYISPWGHGIPQTDYKMATTKNSRLNIAKDCFRVNAISCITGFRQRRA